MGFARTGKIVRPTWPEGSLIMSNSVTVNSAYIRGSEAVPVTVTASIAPGFPSLDIVGVPDRFAGEECSRIRCGAGSAGYEIPRGIVTVAIEQERGFATRDISCHGLAIAYAVLLASGQIPEALVDELGGTMLYGCINLDGSVSRCGGEVAVQRLAERLGMRPLFASGSEVIAGGACLGVSNLRDLACGDARFTRIAPVEPTRMPLPSQCASPLADDLVDAIRCAVGAGRGIAVVGGSDAQREAIVSTVYRLMGELPEVQRPERAALSSITGQSVADAVGGIRPIVWCDDRTMPRDLIGGGRPVRPGCITQAHGGILVCDIARSRVNELAWWLRGPIADKSATVVRVDGAFAMPSDFLPVFFFPDADANRKACCMSDLDLLEVRPVEVCAPVI